MIKGITPQLLQMGCIKIGKKGDSRATAAGGTFQMPTKIDHFLITTMETGPDNNYMPDQQMMGKIKASGAMTDQKKNLIEIPIRLLYNDIDLNFPTRYAAYDGKKCHCSGDGETATREGSGEIKCPCNLLKAENKSKIKCKPNGVLTCLLDGADYLGGCYKFRTTSWNTITSMLGSLTLLNASTQGNMAFVPLTLVMQPKTVTIPGGNGKTTKVYVVSIIFQGTVEDLHNKALENAQQNALYHQKIEQIEVLAKEQVRQIDFFKDSPESETDFADEFYSESDRPEITAAPESNRPAFIPPESKEEQITARSFQAFGVTAQMLTEYMRKPLIELTEAEKTELKTLFVDLKEGKITPDFLINQNDILPVLNVDELQDQVNKYDTQLIDQAMNELGMKKTPADDDLDGWNRLAKKVQEAA